MGKHKSYNSCLALCGLVLLGAICLPQAQPFGLREGFCILVPALVPALVVALWQGYTLCSVKTIGPVVLFMAVGLLLPRWMYGAFPVKMDTATLCLRTCILVAGLGILGWGAGRLLAKLRDVCCKKC